MRFVSFDPFRTLGVPGVTYVKPEDFWAHRELLSRAAALLFPEYWQIHALSYGLGVRIFPSLSSYHLGHDKVEMTRAFWTVCPDHVPRTLILPNTAEASERILDEFGLPLVAKRARSARGEGVFLIQTREDWDAYAAAHELLYAQELLASSRDLRVVVIGEEIAGAYWREGSAGEFLHNVARGGQIRLDGIPSQALELVSAVAKRLGINHAGFDLMEHDGQLYLLEFNRLFGYRGLIAQGVDVAAHIARYLEQLVGPECPPAPPTTRLAS